MDGLIALLIKAVVVIVVLWLLVQVVLAIA
jgi:hypothetical protein